MSRERKPNKTGDMAAEYLIRTTSTDIAPFVALCVHLGGQQVASDSPTFHFRAPGTERRSTSYDASVVLDPGEIWLCDCGGPHVFLAVLLRHLLDAALMHSDSCDGVRVTNA